MSAFPSNVSDLKKTIRRDMLARRDALAPSETERARDVLWSRLENILRDAGEKSAAPLTVMSYMAFRGEFPTEDFCRKVIDSGMKLVLPITDRDFNIHAFPVSNLSELKTSRLGIQEPDPEICQEVSAEDPDIIILPGVAFDCAGGRIGFGKGCYDRFLSGRKRDVTLIGAAYDFQITEFPLPADPYDIPMDYIVTEKRMICCK